MHLLDALYHVCIPVKTAKYKVARYVALAPMRGTRILRAKRLADVVT